MTFVRSLEQAGSGALHIASDPFSLHSLSAVKLSKALWENAIAWAIVFRSVALP